MLRSPSQIFRYATTALTTLLVLASGSVSGQSVLEQIGYTQLANELGGSLPTGASSTVGLVEAFTVTSATSGLPAADREFGFIPDLNNGNLVGKTIDVFPRLVPDPTDITIVDAAPTGHSTGSAARLFGATSASPDVDNVDVLNADTFVALFSQTNDPLDLIASPLLAGGKYSEILSWDVSSHSYILNGFSSDADATRLAMGLDRFVNASDSVIVVGSSNASPTLSNGDPNPNYNRVPEGLAPAYNLISVGKSNGNHGAGLTTFYGPNGEVDVSSIGGRVKVEIVAPESTTSAATPRVGSAAALLHDAGNGDDSTRSETIKAILLAGATKDEFASWDKTSTRPLDERFGAGELNVYNSYKIQADGEQEGTLTAGGAPVDSLGWDYEASFDPANDQYYRFIVSADELGDEFSAVLNWHIDIADTPDPGYSPMATLANFDLELTRDSDGMLIDVSQSSVDNVEHIYATGLDAGTYTLKVSGDSDEAYGLAWRLNTILNPVAVPEPSSIVLFAGIWICAGFRRVRN